jgi:AAA domain-containing protein
VRSPHRQERPVEAIRDAYVEAGYRVHGLAWTNAVVQDMKRDGFTKASTMASEFKRLEIGPAKWDFRTVLIVDEAAMLATKHMAELTAKARASGAKLILVGDDKQLASIERGGMFSALRQEHGAVELHEVRRVADAEQKRAFNRMHAGDFQTALDVFEQRGSIHWSNTQDAARDALVSKYVGDSVGEAGGKRFVFAHTNARSVLQIAGILGDAGQLHPRASLMEGVTVAVSIIRMRLAECCRSHTKEANRSRV